MPFTLELDVLGLYSTTNVQLLHLLLAMSCFWKFTASGLSFCCAAAADISIRLAERGLILSDREAGPDPSLCYAYYSFLSALNK